MPINLNIPNKASGDRLTAVEFNLIKQTFEQADSEMTRLENEKVATETGKQLSDQNFTIAEKNKLTDMQAGAEPNNIVSVAGKVGLVTLNKVDVGLNNVDNTSDSNKPISLTQAAALALKVNAEAGKQLSDQNYSLTEKNKLTNIQEGAQINNVTSVAGKQGVVLLTKQDVNLGNIDNTSDVNKPVSLAAQALFDNKVNVEIGKSLSTRDYTLANEQKLDAIEDVNFDGIYFEEVEELKEGVPTQVIQPKDMGLLAKLQALPAFKVYIDQLIDMFVNAPAAASLEVIGVASSTFANVAPDDRGEYNITFTNLLSGDYILVFSNRPAGTGNLNVPAGWTQLFLNGQIQILARERQGGDSLTYTFFKTVAPNLYAENGILAVAVRGFSGAEIIGVTLGTNNIGQVGGVATVNEVTVATNDEYLALAFIADQNDPTALHDYSNGFTREARIAKTSYDQVLSVGAKTLLNGGGSGTTTIASTGNPESVMVVLKKNKV